MRRTIKYYGSIVDRDRFVAWCRRLPDCSVIALREVVNSNGKTYYPVEITEYNFD